MIRSVSRSGPTRRSVLQGAAAGAALIGAPALVRAQSYGHTRKNLMSPDAAKDLASYAKGVEAMLKLPPDHPHNWYRNAMIHLLDCPHGNWWFASWHRGYLGYFEEIIRTQSGDPDFALPYWDWTTEPRVPAQFFGTALDPENALYALDWPSFDSAYRAPMEAVWNGFTPAQLSQQAARGNADFATLWRGAQGSFFDRRVARRISARRPGLSPCIGDNVSAETIALALKPAAFAMQSAGDSPRSAFNSPITATHHGFGGYAILENDPHNQVHGCVGGFMGRFLSSVDPIFFMHHCNIDRLWDVWTRKQQANGGPTGPLPANAAAFDAEEFLFYLDANGDPVTGAGNITAADYMTTDRFGYGYTAATGEDSVQFPVASAADVTATAGASMVAQGQVTAERPGIASLALSEPFAQSLGAPQERVQQVAHLTLVPPANVSGLRYNVFLSPKGVAPDTSPDSPEFAADITFFGTPHLDGSPIVVTVGISKALARLEAMGVVAPGAEVDITVVAVTDAAQRLSMDAMSEAVDSTLQSVSFEAI